MKAIDNPRTHVGCLYEYMRSNPCDWLSPHRISELTGTTAPHTIVSQLREALPEGLEIDSYQEPHTNRLGRTTTITRYRLAVSREVAA